MLYPALVYTIHDQLFENRTRKTGTPSCLTVVRRDAQARAAFAPEPVLQRV
jgi:hypothetical protein